ncbi:hypothetical protein AAGS61_17715 [Lysinibacillus sp. KU-BSD001]|uniref:hypothetical protein n=1 Tax=Lysinibacillus sp. KU-BSD001 TaxID=3141328 RepID=UPI0036E0C139
MPTNKLTIVPVIRNPIHHTTSLQSPQQQSVPSCVMKTATAEISFFNGVGYRHNIDRYRQF